ncbi:MAG: DUF4143 domain-containing protein, partial [Bacilli bacterium]
VIFFHSISEEPCKQYLMDLFNSVQLKDIVQYNKVRDAELLEKVLSYIIGCTGNIITAFSISKFFKSEKRSASVDTIMNFMRYCEEAFLIYRAKRQDLKGKQILSTYDKFYVADHGIREALFGSNQRDINQVLENIVYMEALRRGYTVSIGKIGDKEIDFVLDRGSRRIYIQVTYLLASEDIVQREFGAYDSIEDNFPKYILSLDEFDFSRNGIIHKNPIEFLLMKEW